MASHYRSLFPTRCQCQWWDQPCPLFPVLHVGRASCRGSSGSREGCPPSEDRHRFSLEDPSAGPSPASRGMEWQGVYRPHAALWVAVCPKDFHGGGRCPRTECLPKGGQLHLSLDDFVVVGALGSEQWAVALDILRQECESLGVPVAEHKTEGPATCLTKMC